MNSANGDHVHRDAVEAAKIVPGVFQIMAEVHGPEEVRHAIAVLLDEVVPGSTLAQNRYNLQLRLVDVKWLDEVIVQAAEAAFAKSHHIADWTAILERKSLYDPRNLHDLDLPNSADKKTAAYFGADPAKWDVDGYGMKVQSEYMNFASAIGHMTEADRHALKPAKFWRDNTSKYKNIAELGLFYASVQTSSVSAESCFGIMRAVERPDKMRQKDPAWRAEIILRYNKWLVDKKWQETVAIVPNMGGTGAATSASPAPYFGPRS